MSNERKDHLAQIRISSEDDDFIKKFGGIKSEIWRIGFQKWSEDLPGKLNEKAEYHKKMYLQCNDKMAKCIDIVNTKNSRIDEICLEYIKFERTIPDDIINLPYQDKSWVESRIKKNKLSIDIDTFIQRCKELKNANKIVNNTL